MVIHALFVVSKKIHIPQVKQCPVVDGLTKWFVDLIVRKSILSCLLIPFV
jgi:hypothetical protein